ncbi:protein kinase [Planctomycetota bacterium]
MAAQERCPEDIFHDAIEISDPSKQAAFLDQACQDDEKLRSEVEALLHYHEKAGDFLQGPLDGADVTLDRPIQEGPGTKIGRYELLELIGEGGMGLVYLARQQEPKRKVALKIVKLGMDTKQVVARFEAERQTLALLAHPNIAHVFDAGTTDTGRPYFVMEYVEGRSITKYCDEQKLSVEQRLELFQQICEGVHHAHQKGIIHRDLKPSNILVSIHGNKAVPKIIDFGIAKAVTQPLTEKTLFTEHGQLLGTPEYMSPEQAEMGTEDIDTRSDIYSLGVLLYELLAGATPFDAKRLRKGGIDHIQQVICQEEPRTPSARLTSMGDKGAPIAERRRTQIITLTRRLHRELEWIPMKAMRKDRSRRYRSASELSDDIQNYLTGVPLIAGPESNVYRARKFVHKHAGFVASAALVAVVIVVGLITSTAFSFSAEKARGEEAAARVEAEQAREQAEQARDEEAALRTQVEQALVRAEKAEKAAQEQRKLAEKRTEDYRRSLYFNSIALGNAHYREENIDELKTQLTTCPEDLRGWEWQRLNHISDQAFMTITPHQGLLRSVCFSPDGRRIISGGKDIKVWDAMTGVEFMTFGSDKDESSRISVSPDGKMIASASGDNSVKVWDTESGKELMALRGHNVLSFSPDGERLALGSGDGTIKLWDIVKGEQVMTLRGHSGAIVSAAFSADGTRLVSAARDGTFRVWNAVTGTALRTVPLENTIWAKAAFSPDGGRIVSYGGNNKIKVWNTSTGEELVAMIGHQRGGVCTVAFSHDGRRILSAGSNSGSTIKLWDAYTGDELMTLRGHRSGLRSAAFSPNSKQIVSCSRDGTIKVWDIDHKFGRMTFHGHQGKVTSVAYSPDGKRLASGSSDTTVKIWDLASGVVTKTLRGHLKGVQEVAFSPDGSRIIATGGDRIINIWDASSGKKLSNLAGHSDSTNAVTFTPDGKYIVSGGGPTDRTVKIWDVQTGIEVATLRGHTAPITSIAISSDGKRIVSAGCQDEDGIGDDTFFRVWDIESGAELMACDHGDGLFSVAISPDNKYIATGGSDHPRKGKTIKIWNAHSGVQLMTLRGHRMGINSVCFSPDGKRILSSSWGDRTVKLWDVETGSQVMTLPTNSQNLSARFSPDGKSIAIGDGNNIVLFESAIPIGGYEARRTGVAACETVDKLYEEHGLYSKVLDKLKTDDTLKSPVHTIALQIANARLWEDAEEQKDAEK